MKRRWTESAGRACSCRALPSCTRARARDDLNPELQSARLRKRDVNRSLIQRMDCDHVTALAAPCPQCLSRIASSRLERVERHMVVPAHHCRTSATINSAASSSSRDRHSDNSGVTQSLTDLQRLAVRPTTSPLTVAAAHQYGKLVVPTPRLHGGSLLSPCRVRSPRCPSLASPVATPRQRSFPKLSTGRLAVGARRASGRGGGARASCGERTVPTVPRSDLRAGAVRRRREIAERCVAVRLVSIGAQVREPRMC